MQTDSRNCTAIRSWRYSRCRWLRGCSCIAGITIVIVESGGMIVYYHMQIINHTETTLSSLSSLDLNFYSSWSIYCLRWVKIYCSYSFSRLNSRSFL